MPGNQWRTELAYSVGQGHTSLVPNPRSTEYPPKPLCYNNDAAPKIGVRFFGNIGSNTYRCGVYVPETGFIYCLPYANGVLPLKIDPVAETAVTFGGGGPGRVYYGSARAPNGAIYGTPSSAATTAVGKLDPITEVFSTFGNNGGGVTLKWEGAILAPNGMIYCMPSSMGTVLMIDPTTDTTTEFGSFGATATKWASGVLAPNGKIYGVPYGSDSVLVIDPATNTASTFGSVQQFAGNITATGKWNRGTLMPDGKIYCFPYNASNILVIDPEFNTLSAFNYPPCSFGGGLFTSAVPVPSFGHFYIDKNNFSVAQTTAAQCFTLAANGRLYGTNAFSDANGNQRNGVYELDTQQKTGTIMHFPEFTQLTQASTAPYLTSVLVADGSIIMVSYSGQQIMKITGLPPASADMYTMPTNIAYNLVGSAYNRHVNK